MAILSPSEPAKPKVQSVRELRVPVSREKQPAAAHFYTQILGLAAWSDQRQIPGGWGIGDQRRGIYFQFRHDPVIEPMRRRLTVEVASLDAVEERLRQSEWLYTVQRGFGVTDQALLVIDPIGHRLEVRQFRPL